MKLLKELCSFPGTSGDESGISSYLLNYVEENQSNWKGKPRILKGHGLQDCVILVFGKPRTAMYAHIDTIGFTVGYDNKLIKVGGPKVVETDLFGKDSKGDIECKMIVNEDEEPEYKYKRKIDRGTALSFKCNFREDDEYVQSCYLDNRLGVWIALRLAETLENGAIVFSTYEEHAGGSAGYLAKYLFNEYDVSQALISDITWVTPGILHGGGVAVSLRDKGIPRKVFVDKILGILKESDIKYQLEVESAGGSDGTDIQRATALIDWCFIGAPETNVHSPDERVHKSDIESMLEAYKLLMAKL